MNSRTIVMSVILCSLSMAGLSQAEIRPYDDRGIPNPDAFDWSGIAIGGSIGTLGVGGEGTVYVLPNLNFRVSAGYLNYSFDDTIDDIDFDMDIDYTTVNFLLDFYPIDTSVFRLSAGLVYADNKIDVSADPKEPKKIGDHVYTPAEMGTISGDLKFDDWSPYIGIGFGNPVRPDSALTVAVDLGMMFQTYETTLKANGTASGTAQFQSDLDDLKHDIDDELDNFKFYPVITVSLSYQF